MPPPTFTPSRNTSIAKRRCGDSRRPSQPVQRVGVMRSKAPATATLIVSAAPTATPFTRICTRMPGRPMQAAGTGM